MFALARATFVGSMSVPTTMPPPLSRIAAAKWIVEMPTELPNSTIRLAPMERAIW